MYEVLKADENKISFTLRAAAEVPTYCVLSVFLVSYEQPVRCILQIPVKTVPLSFVSSLFFPIFPFSLYFEMCISMKAKEKTNDLSFSLWQHSQLSIANNYYAVISRACTLCIASYFGSADTSETVSQRSSLSTNMHAGKNIQS